MTDKTTQQGYLIQNIINSLYASIMSGNISFSDKDKKTILSQIDQLKNALESDLYNKLDELNPSNN